eukprot:6209008-Pleurochrysis_carterae.AAC.2
MKPRSADAVAAACPWTVSAETLLIAARPRPTAPSTASSGALCAAITLSAATPSTQLSSRHGVPSSIAAARLGFTPATSRSSAAQAAVTPWSRRYCRTAA